jgi:hypothetical protein
MFLHNAPPDEESTEVRQFYITGKSRIHRVFLKNWESLISRKKPAHGKSFQQ